MHAWKAASESLTVKSPFRQSLPIPCGQIPVSASELYFNQTHGRCDSQARATKNRAKLFQDLHSPGAELRPADLLSGLMSGQRRLQHRRWDLRACLCPYRGYTRDQSRSAQAKDPADSAEKL